MKKKKIWKCHINLILIMHKYKTKMRMIATSQNHGYMYLMKKSEHGNADIENQENEEIHIQND